MQSPPTGPEEPPGGWGVHLPPGVDPRNDPQQLAGGRTDSTAGAALALGVISVPLSFCCGVLAFAVNLIGLGLGIAAVVRATRAGGRFGNRPLAYAALVVNGLVLVANIAIIAYFVFGAFGGVRLFP